MQEHCNLRGAACSSNKMIKYQDVEMFLPMIEVMLTWTNVTATGDTE
jgi:hypothetical protein